jgi:hypothetical protein
MEKKNDLDLPLLQLKRIHEQCHFWGEEEWIDCLDIALRSKIR